MSAIGRSSNGRTPPSGGGYLGSSPSLPAKFQNSCYNKLMKKPFLHALSAIAYIVLIVSIVGNIEHNFPEGSLLAPMVMLSLLVLSVTMMWFFFFYHPLHLFIEGKKKEALDFLAKTIGIFACFVVVFIVATLLI